MPRLLESIAKQLFKYRGEFIANEPEKEDEIEIKSVLENAFAWLTAPPDEGDASWALGWVLLVLILTVIYLWACGDDRSGSGRSTKSKTICVQALTVYPIKSCRGIKMESVPVDKRGLRHDRLFMLVDSTSGKFTSQRKYPKMATIETIIDANKGILSVTAPGMDVISFSLMQPALGEKMDVTVWGDQCVALDMGDELAKWFCTALGLKKDWVSGWPLRFVRMFDEVKRPTDPKYAPNGETGFADGFPFLLASAESLGDVNKRLVEGGQDPVVMANFRPNIVVEGGGAWCEDAWRGSSIYVGANRVRFNVVKPCARCTIPNLDPETGEALTGGQPSKTMKAFRTGKALEFENPKWKGHIFFGQNLDHSEGFREGCTLSVGDEVVLS